MNKTHKRLSKIYLKHTILHYFFLYILLFYVFTYPNLLSVHIYDCIGMKESIN